MDLFLSKESIVPLSLADLNAPVQTQEQNLSRYEINLFVDNSELKGAPIIFDNHPTFINLLGCMERESEMGALTTNLVKFLRM